MAAVKKFTAWCDICKWFTLHIQKGLLIKCTECKIDSILTEPLSVPGLLSEFVNKPL